MKHRDRLSLFERLMVVPYWSTPKEPDRCWPWQGSRDAKGYGFIWAGGQSRRVHIAAWELVKGRKVRAGYTLDHGCRNKACWRPSHMEEVTRAVNTARGNRANPRDTSRARAARRRIAPDVMRDALDSGQVRSVGELTQCDGPDSYE